MIKLSRNRISKLRCISCGCREKKLAILSNPLKTTILVGFATVCCNCGHIQHYVLKNTEETVNNDDITSILENNYKVTKITCGTEHAYCPRRKCKFWATCKKRPMHPPYEGPQSVYKPRYEEDKPVPPPAKVNCDNGRRHSDNKPCPMPEPMTPYFDTENRIKYESTHNHKHHNGKTDAPKYRKNRFV